MTTCTAHIVASKTTRGPPTWWALWQRGTRRRLHNATSSSSSIAEAAIERPTKFKVQRLSEAVASEATCQDHGSTTVSIPRETDGSHYWGRSDSVWGCSATPNLAVARLPCILQWSSWCRKHRRAWPLVGNAALPQLLIHARRFSIMDRYNRVGSSGKLAVNPACDGMIRV